MAPPGPPSLAPDGSAPDDGLANLDLHRAERLGMVEAVWGEHKSADQILEILLRLHRAGVQGLVTRVSDEKAAAVLQRISTIQTETNHKTARESQPETSAETGNKTGKKTSAAEGQPGSHVPLVIGHHAEAQLLIAPPVAAPDLAPGSGDVVVVCAGTSDRRVALEAQLCLACHGIPCELVVDVGVAGLHRLLDRLEQLRRAKVLIACAGMEGALPTVLAGLLPQPVIAVPVSVGYGVSAGGIAALHGMLASCAPGLTVVNIDNGYGAAMAALRILGVAATSGTQNTNA